MKVRDPVCGKEIGLADAAASEEFDGWAYFFCSSGCRDFFKSAPVRFLSAPDSVLRKTGPIGNP